MHGAQQRQASQPASQRDRAEIWASKARPSDENLYPALPLMRASSLGARLSRPPIHPCRGSCVWQALDLGENWQAVSERASQPAKATQRAFKRASKRLILALVLQTSERFVCFALLCFCFVLFGARQDFRVWPLLMSYFWRAGPHQAPRGWRIGPETRSAASQPASQQPSRRPSRPSRPSRRHHHQQQQQDSLIRRQARLLTCVMAR